MSDKSYWVWFGLKFVCGNVASDSILSHFNYDAEKIYRASKSDYSEIVRNPEICESLCDKNLDRAFAVLDYCERENIGLLTPDSGRYPQSLMYITGIPIVLYYKGRLPDFQKALSIGVVGTRNVTEYGSLNAYTISYDLAKSKIIVVSGMALGTDAAAHRGALDALGHTVAVLGCGIDVVYPKENASLMKELFEYGTVITDYPPGTRPNGYNFPQRNRIISGISQGVLVVEAAQKSGALITATHAQKQGKLLYAVPGKVGELVSLGTNELIRNGAKMVSSASDIIADFKTLYDISEKYSNPFESKKRMVYTAAQYQNRPKYSSDNSEYSDKNEGYMSFPSDKKEKAARERYESEMSDSDIYRGRLKYPDEIVPENGYEVKLFKEERFGKGLKGYGTGSGLNHYGNAEKVTQKKDSYVNGKIKVREKAPYADTESTVRDKDLNTDTEITIRERKRKFGADAGKNKALIKEISEEQRDDFSDLDERESAVLKFISETQNCEMDKLLSLGYGVSELFTVLTMLEIKGKIKQLPGGYYTKIRF